MLKFVYCVSHMTYPILHQVLNCDVDHSGLWRLLPDGTIFCHVNDVPYRLPRHSHSNSCPDRSGQNCVRNSEIWSHVTEAMKRGVKRVTGFG